MIAGNAFKVTRAHSMDDAAARILDAVRKGKTHLYFPKRTLWLIPAGAHVAGLAGGLDCGGAGGDEVVRGEDNKDGKDEKDKKDSEDLKETITTAGWFRVG